MSRVDKREYEDWKGFGARVKKYRKSIGMTREKLSEMIDRTENYVLSIEKGDKSCSVHTLHQICKSLKVSADQLLYGEDETVKKEYNNKKILQEIIERCNEEELEIIKDLIVAIYPNFNKIINERK